MKTITLVPVASLICGLMLDAASVSAAPSVFKSTADWHVESGPGPDMRVIIREYNSNTGHFTAQIWNWGECAANRRGVSPIVPSNSGQPQTQVKVRANLSGNQNPIYTIKILNVDDTSGNAPSFFKTKGDVTSSYEWQNHESSWIPMGNMRDGQTSGSKCAAAGKKGGPQTVKHADVNCDTDAASHPEACPQRQTAP